MLPPKPNQASIKNAINEAQQIVDSAKKKSEEIISNANSRVKNLEAQAYKEGFAKGQAQAINSAINLIKEHVNLRKNISEEAAGLSYKILEKVFHMEAPEVLDPIKELAKRLVSSVSIGDKIDLLIHPSNRQSISRYEKEFSALARGVELYVVEKNEMPKDSILLRTDFGEIQVSLEELLAEVSEQVRLLDVPIKK